DFSWPWEVGLATWSVDPSPIAEISSRLGGSLLESERREKRVRKNILRSLWGHVLQLYKQVRARVYNGVRHHPNCKPPAAIPPRVSAPLSQTAISFPEP